MIEYRDFEYKLTGLWEEILSMYGIDVPNMRGKNSINHPCPCCGGDDRAHWREQDGRLALYCRSCAPDTMKSPEKVIQEVCGIGFSELVNNLADFVDHKTPEDLKKAKIKTNSKPKRNMPQGHKQDHDKSIAFLGNCELLDSFSVLLAQGVQHPEKIASNNGYPVLEIKNENDVLVNLCCVYETNVTFIAGGLSYGAWHTISKCDFRNTDGFVWCDDIFTGLHHWWKTGQETRITFSELNTHWMKLVGIISEQDTIIK